MALSGGTEAAALNTGGTEPGGHGHIDLWGTDSKSVIRQGCHSGGDFACVTL